MKTPILSNKLYDAIKWLITIGLPAVGALYFMLAEAWDFNNSRGVNGTINAIIAFLGLLIGYSGRQYRKGEGAPDGDLIVTNADGEKYLALGVNKSIEAMTSKDCVRLNVVEKDFPEV